MIRRSASSSSSRKATILSSTRLDVAVGGLVELHDEGPCLVAHACEKVIEFEVSPDFRPEDEPNGKEPAHFDRGQKEELGERLILTRSTRFPREGSRTTSSGASSPVLVGRALLAVPRAPPPLGSGAAGTLLDRPGAVLGLLGSDAPLPLSPFPSSGPPPPAWRSAGPDRPSRRPGRAPPGTSASGASGGQSVLWASGGPFLRISSSGSS